MNQTLEEYTSRFWKNIFRPKYIDLVQILRALRRESLADRRAKQLKSSMFKTANNLVPEYLSNKLTSIPSIDIPNSQYPNLRGTQHNLFTPRPNTEALRKSFRYRGAVTWNSLSVEATQATTLNSFYPLLKISNNLT